MEQYFGLKCVHEWVGGICNNDVEVVKSFVYDRGIRGIGPKMFGTPKVYRVTI